MLKICDNCGSVAAYNSHFQSYVCAKCGETIKIPLTNYDRIKNMSIEEMARENVRVIYDGEHLVWCTSDSTESGYYPSYADALAHELDWLNSPAEEGQK